MITEGVGSCFWLELVADHSPEPVSTSPSAPAPRLGAATPARGRRTVLLVEDDLPSQSLVQAQLSNRSDLKLIVAANGREGIALALAHRPDVILMDNGMPEITGRQAVQLLANDPRTAAIPVIAISAGAGAEPLPGQEADPIRWFRQVAKPFSQGALLQAIDAALDGSG